MKHLADSHQTMTVMSTDPDQTNRLMNALQEAAKAITADLKKNKEVLGQIAVIFVSANTDGTMGSTSVLGLPYGPDESIHRMESVLVAGLLSTARMMARAGTPSLFRIVSNDPATQEQLDAGYSAFETSPPTVN